MVYSDCIAASKQNQIQNLSLFVFTHALSHSINARIQIDLQTPHVLMKSVQWKLSLINGLPHCLYSSKGFQSDMSINNVLNENSLKIVRLSKCVVCFEFVGLIQNGPVHVINRWACRNKKERHQYRPHFNEISCANIGYSRSQSIIHG